MSRVVAIGDRLVGEGHPAYVVAEIGINHNGNLDMAKQIIDVAVAAGCDAVKFQKRTPELCVPPEQREIPRETPWGTITYLDYRRKIEFGQAEFQEIDRYCKSRGIHWFASCWDQPSVEFMERFAPVCYKIASASLTDDGLLKKMKLTERPLVLSTGMSTLDQIRHAVSVLGTENLILPHSTSAYPCAPAELNLRMINTLQDQFDCPIGYSGHEVGLQTTVAAVALGACLIERHVTLDRTMWGSDQAASVEPPGMNLLVRDIRVIERALGTGVKEVYESEQAALTKLRVNNSGGTC